MMNDGVNSASRYYLNHVRDAFRQAAIDVLTGHAINEEVLIAAEKDEQKSDEEQIERVQAEEEIDAQVAERVKELIEDCKKMLISDVNTIVGAWGLIDNDPVTGKNPLYVYSTRIKVILIL